MSYSEVEIANLALSMLGAESIRNFEEINKRARLAKNLFNFSRDHLLGQIVWTFANGYKQLNEVDLEGVSIPEGTKAYQLPEDCLVPNDIDPKGSKSFWEIRGNVLYTNRSPVFLHYTKKVVNTELFTVTFVNVLASYLAYRLAPAISQNPKLTAQMREGYMMAIQESYGVETAKDTTYKHPDAQYNNDTFNYPHSLKDNYPDDPNRGY